VVIDPVWLVSAVPRLAAVIDDGLVADMEAVAEVILMQILRCWTTASLDPDVGQGALLADPRFILPPEFDRLVLGGFGDRLRNKLVRVFCVLGAPLRLGMAGRTEIWLKSSHLTVIACRRNARAGSRRSTRLASVTGPAASAQPCPPSDPGRPRSRWQTRLVAPRLACRRDIRASWQRAASARDCAAVDARRVISTVIAAPNQNRP
jgi:hypothetical protein